MGLVICDLVLKACTTRESMNLTELPLLWKIASEKKKEKQTCNRSYLDYREKFLSLKKHEAVLSNNLLGLSW